MGTGIIKNIVIWGLGSMVILGIAYVFLKFLMPFTVPFIIAYLLSYFTCKCALWLEKKTGIDNTKYKNSDVLWRAAVLILFVLGIGAFLWFGASAVAREVSEALRSFADSVGASNSVVGVLDGIASRIAFRFGVPEMKETLSSIISSGITRLSDGFADGATRLFSALPSVLIGAAVTTVALFYFTFGREKAISALKSIISEKNKKRFSTVALAAVKGVARFSRAYFVIISVTFAELFAGFLILGVDHPAVLAMFISIIDVFPVLGVGTVLLPWAVYSFFTGNILRGAGLVIILVLVWVVRQPLEVKLMGKSAGVHPIFALAAVYTGFRLAGVAGLVAAPFILSAVCAVGRNCGEGKATR